MDTKCGFEIVTHLTIEEDHTAGGLIQYLDGSDEAFLYAIISQDLPYTIMPHSIEGLLEIYKVMEQSSDVIIVTNSFPPSLNSSTEILSAPGDFVGKLCMASFISSLNTGSAEGALDIESPSIKLISGCMGWLYRSQQYCVHLFRTAVFPVRSSPTLSSMTVDLLRHDF